MSDRYDGYGIPYTQPVRVLEPPQFPSSPKGKALEKRLSKNNKGNGNFVDRYQVEGRGTPNL